MHKRLKAEVRNITIENRATIIEPCNLYYCYLGDNCFVGPFCEIQKDVFIGKNTRIQSHSFICSEVTIGDNCFIGHGVMFTNDKFNSNTPELLPTIIGNNVLIGSGAVILPVNICDYTIIGAGAVVTKDIKEPGTYAGNPARKINDRINKPTVE